MRSRGCTSQEAVDAEPPQEAAVRGAAAKRDVLAVVEPVAVAANGERGAAEARARLVQRHLRARVGALERRGEPREPAADDGDPRSPSVRRTPTRLRGSTSPSPTAERRPCAKGRATARSAIRSSRRRYYPLIASTQAALRRSRSGTSPSPRSSHPSPRSRLERDDELGIGPRCGRRGRRSRTAQDPRPAGTRGRSAGPRQGRAGCCRSAARRRGRRRAARAGDRGRKQSKSAEREPPDRAGDAAAVALELGERRVLGPAHVGLGAVDQVARTRRAGSGSGRRRRRPRRSTGSSLSSMRASWRADVASSSASFSLRGQRAVGDVVDAPRECVDREQRRRDGRAASNRMPA